MDENYKNEAATLISAFEQAEQLDKLGHSTKVKETNAQKKGMFAKLRDFLSHKKDATNETATSLVKPKPSKKSIGASVRTLSKTTDEDMRKFNDFLGAIEVQLDKVEGQNEHLLRQLSQLEKNNDMLLEQVKTLTHNNNQITEQYNNMKKREKVAKIMAIIAATCSIGLAVFNIIFNIILPNVG